MFLELCDELSQELEFVTKDPFEFFLRGAGQTHREVKHRLTYETRLREMHFFVKRHLGCGWGEVWKEWYRLRKPVVSARTEWEAAEQLSAAGVNVPKVLGKGERGRYPHAVESFVVLEALENCETLEQFSPGWCGYFGPRWVALKHKLLHEIARTARKMHHAGINHRDFYLNHFLINRRDLEGWTPGDPLTLYLIDLHRVQTRSSVPGRWLIKDLASLLFSALDAGLTSTDCIRFLINYLGPDWKSELRADIRFWQSISRKAVRLYSSFHGRPPKLPTLLEI